MTVALTVVAAAPAWAQSQADLDAAQQNTSDWLYATHDYTGQRYVALDQINSDNASQLAPVCTYPLGLEGTLQSNTIVHGGTIFIATPSALAAIGATDCAERWTYTWEPQNEGGIPSNRGPAIGDGKVVMGTTDGFLLAVDAASGELVWSQEIRTEGSGESVSAAPLVYDGMVIVGPSVTTRGWIAAFDLNDGSEIWRFHTIPQEGDPAIETWGNQEALANGDVGGGSVWTVVSLDAEAGLLYVPVGNTNPAFYGGDRPGDNLYTNSLVVLDVHTGEMQWYWQMEPHGVHNWDTSQAGPLFTTTIDGVERNLVASTGKRGILYILDRDSHEVLRETPITTLENMDVPLTREGVYVCPGYLGGVQWNGPAYSPDTGLLYVPAVDWCSTFYEAPEEPRGGGYRFAEDDPGNGWVTAVDPVTGEARWAYEGGAPMIAAVTATAGNVLFTGTLAGRFLALDATTGDELLSYDTGGSMAGGVVTYEIDGRQYVAAASGNTSGLWRGSFGDPTMVIFALPQ